MKGLLIPLQALLAGAILLPGIAGCAAAGSWAGPRNAAYARHRGDTLRYVLVTESFSSHGLGGLTRDGPKSRREVWIAMTLTAPQRVTTWVEAVREETQGRTSQTAGPEIVGRPFVLAVGPMGIDSIVGEECVPEPWPNLFAELGALLPPLPGGPLPRGREWQVNQSQDLSSDTETGQQTRTGTYRVVGDSVVGSAVVLVVEYETVLRRETHERPVPPSSPPPPGAPLLLPRVVGIFQEDRGRFYFDPAAGRIVRHTRTGTYSRTWPVYGAAEAARQAREYSDTLTLVSSSRTSHRGR